MKWLHVTHPPLSCQDVAFEFISEYKRHDLSTLIKGERDSIVASIFLQTKGESRAGSMGHFCCPEVEIRLDKREKHKIQQCLKA